MTDPVRPLPRLRPAGRYRSGIESRLSLPLEPSSASLARHFVRDILAGAGIEELDDPATLLTSELVTNAVLHARSAAELVVRVEGRRLWVGVADGIATAPVRKNYGPQAGTGRGILLVEHVASAWGTEASDHGKVVWFELVADDDIPGGGSSVSALSGAGPQLLARVDQEPGGRTAHRARPRGPLPPLRRSLRSARRRQRVHR